MEFEPETGLDTERSRSHKMQKTLLLVHMVQDEDECGPRLINSGSDVRSGEGESWGDTYGNG